MTKNSLATAPHTNPFPSLITEDFVANYNLSTQCGNVPKSRTAITVKRITILTLTAPTPMLNVSTNQSV